MQMNFEVSNDVNQLTLQAQVARAQRILGVMDKNRSSDAVMFELRNEKHYHDLSDDEKKQYEADVLLCIALEYAAHSSEKSQIEAVQIEWISNGVLVRGKNESGTFCTHFRDMDHFINTELGAAAKHHKLKNNPVPGDKCIVYFGMTNVASE